jgi:SM-20-related protein
MNKILTKVYDGCIPNNTLINIQKKYGKSFSYGWKANRAMEGDQGHWNIPVCVQNKKSLVDISDKLAIESPDVFKVWDIIQMFFTGKRKLSRAYINGYTYGTDGYLHRDDPFFEDLGDDSPYAETIIVYLNQTWDADWCGETVIMTEEKEIATSILPKFGRVLSFDGKCWHGSRPLSRLCHDLRSVLVFKTLKSEEKNALDFLMDATQGLRHTNRSFIDHLTGTALLLLKIGSPQYVAMAGMFHSIYETEFYKHGRNFSREQIQSFIGLDSEALAHKFCTVENRFETLVDDYKKNPSTFNAHMLLIEYCNLLEQNGVSERTKLIESILKNE